MEIKLDLPTALPVCLHQFGTIFARDRLLCDFMERGSFAQEFIAGNVGGILGITIVYPLDTLKIRQQTNPNGGSMIQVFNTMRNADGVMILF